MKNNINYSKIIKNLNIYKNLKTILNILLKKLKKNGK